MFRRSLLWGLGLFGIHAVRRTRRADLVSLIESLRPLGGGVELIRLGPDGDGGYLIPDDLDDIRHGFSPGVEGESGFEADLVTRGVQVHLADASVDGPAQSNPDFVFTKKHVGTSSSSMMMTMDEWKRNSIGDYSGDLLLQMDIEGAEFDVLLSLSPGLLSQFRIMVIEFHHLEQLWNGPWFSIVSDVFRKLLTTHSVVHIHPNNCCGSFASQALEIPLVAEFTFYRNDRIRDGSFASRFPHPLDWNNTDKPTLRLPTCWYRSAEFGRG